MKYSRALVAIAGLLLAATCSFAGDLLSQFLNPPEAAKPWVYWFWLNGNITREGITADLEAMHRVGIGGVLIMEVDQGIPKGPAPFASPKWREMFKYMVAEAGRLGIEVDMNNDAGWNGSGGPWVTPQHAMQKVVWSETFVQGPQSFDGWLPQPETVAGYYRDIAVLAFRYRANSRDPEKRYHIAHLDAKNGLVRGWARRIPAWPTPASRPRRSSAMRPPIKKSIAARLSILPPGSIRTDIFRGTLRRASGRCSGSATRPPAPSSALRPTAGQGLECDKLSRDGIDEHFAGLMAKLIADVGPAAGKDGSPHAYRQLGKPFAELDAADARGIPKAARLRSLAAAARDDRPGGR